MHVAQHVQLDALRRQVSPELGMLLMLIRVGPSPFKHTLRTPCVHTCTLIERLKGDRRRRTSHLENDSPSEVPPGNLRPLPPSLVPWMKGLVVRHGGKRNGQHMPHRKWLVSDHKTIGTFQSHKRHGRVACGWDTPEQSSHVAAAGPGGWRHANPWASFFRVI